MPPQDPERKLTAILSADVAGYSLLMRDNEEATVRTLTHHRTVMGNFIQQYRGRVVDPPGDNLLAQFASVQPYSSTQLPQSLGRGIWCFRAI